MLFESIVREDRSIVDLLDADYTFVNERLARHYGIPDIRGRLLPPDVAGRSQPAAWASRAGQFSDGDLHRHANIAGDRAANGFCRIFSARRRRRRRLASKSNLEADPKAKKPNSLRERLELHRTQARLRVVPQNHGSDRILAGEFRPDRKMARHRRRRADRFVRAVLWTARRCNSVADLRKAVLSRSGRVRHDDDGKADDLCARPAGRILPICRRCVRSSATPAKNDYRFSSLIFGVCEELTRSR